MNLIWIVVILDKMKETEDNKETGGCEEREKIKLRVEDEM